MIGLGRILKWRPRTKMQTQTAPARTDDPREVPLYSLAEAAAYLGIAASTLRSWIKGRVYNTTTGPKFFKPLIEAADPARSRLSFANLAEAHILQATRDKNIPIPNVRAAIDYVQERYPSPHPLIAADFHYFGKELFLKQIEGDPVNASRSGQLGIREILNELLQRLERDRTGYPIRIFPIQTQRLVLDLHIAAGQPVIKGTRIPARILYARREAGDTVPQLAEDYGISEADVEEAIRHFAAA